MKTIETQGHSASLNEKPPSSATTHKYIIMMVCRAKPYIML